MFYPTNIIVCKYEQILILMAATHPKKSWDRDQIKVKRLSKLNYLTILK